MADSDQRPAAASLDSPIRRLRLLSRLAIALLLDLIEIARGRRHIIDTLLIGVAVQANLGVADAEPAGLIADDMRRPITINAMSASLALPFETVRRRVRRLADEGLCQLAPGGVIVPAAVLGRPECEEMARRASERVRAFFYDMAELDLLPELPPPAVEIDPQSGLSASAMRIIADYVLREVAGLLESMGGPIDGLIAFDIFRANTAHFSHELRGGEGYGARDMVDDSQRRPVRVAETAARLGMPAETVRRHIVGLVERGVCRRVDGGGVIVPAEFFAREDFREAVFRNAANLTRLLAGLGRLGVLDLWTRTQSRRTELV